MIIHFGKLIDKSIGSKSMRKFKRFAILGGDGVFGIHMAKYLLEENSFDMYWKKSQETRSLLTRRG